MVVAINHQSFDGLARKLLPTDLPVRLRKARIIDVPIEQSQWFEPATGLDAQGALGQLRGIPSKISGLRQSHPDAEFAFTGKAHIPLAFWLAHRCFSEVPLLVFELDRSTGAWRHLPEDPHRLSIRSAASGAGGAGDAVIKIEISYSINDADIAAIVPRAAATRTIAAEPPALDCVATRGDAEEIANRFRTALDELVNASTIYVFIAAPMSVVAALGRRVSQTIHAPIIVHNFNDKTRPRYAWGVQINAKDGPRVVQNHTN